MSKHELPKKILKLDEIVVNRIAAGEIIQRPSNALKELIENSLDAKATTIQISVKEGGLKLLQIHDNGTGIRKEDLSILCERFTTSKLQTFEDLRSIQTYGFRGEALSSISHIALLNIVTKTVEDKCAYKASYIDGKMTNQPVPCAGNQGTIIMIENLFYNVATRRRTLSNPSEEFLKISEVVMKYAIHNPKVGFSLKKDGKSIPEVRTVPNSSKINNIRAIYGNDVARELLDIELDDKTFQFKMHALVTNQNYNSKKIGLLLFINNRLVDSSTIKRMLEDLYSIYIGKKSHPWCYISLDIAPRNVDVNIHPTKHEVRFLHEEAIINKMKTAIDDKLMNNDSSRTFYLQTKLPQTNPIKEILPDTKKPQEMIRADANDQKLDKFNFTLTKEKNSTSSKQSVEKTTSNEDKEKDKLNSSSAKVEKIQLSEDDSNDESTTEQDKISVAVKACENVFRTFGKEMTDDVVKFKSYSINSFQREVKLTSVLKLRKQIEENFDENLKEILRSLVFVGCVDETKALIQSGVNLYLCDTEKLAEELFYEIMLYDFANYGVIKFSEAISVYDLAMLGLETEEAGWKEDCGTKEEIATNVKELLIEKSDMMKEYFSIVIDDKGRLKSLPVLLNNYFPNEVELPLYVLRLATEVDWTTEQPCFENICRETARFYSKINPIHDQRDWKYVTEHVLYPAIKESLLPPKDFAHDTTILQIASLPNLYKIFERC